MGRSPESTLFEWGRSLAALHRRASYGRWFGRYVLLGMVVFFASALAGFAIGDAIPIEQLRTVTPPRILPEFSTASIALNNLRVLGLLAGGLVTMGVISVIVLTVNGLLAGAVVALAVQQSSWAVVLGALVPHGVVELPAFWLAAGITFRFAYRVVRYALGYDETPLTRLEAYELAVLFGVLALAIVVAAWIEVNVTPAVVRWIAGPGAV